VQDAYFHDLREHAAQVFAEVSGEVDDEAKARMFAFCRHQVALPDESADKCLSNSWVMPGIVRPRHVAITIAAQEYALRYA
jgi:tellurite resistance protein